jgi:hypothetical protein
MCDSKYSFCCGKQAPLSSLLLQYCLTPHFTKAQLTDIFLHDLGWGHFLLQAINSYNHNYGLLGHHPLSWFPYLKDSVSDTGFYVCPQATQLVPIDRTSLYLYLWILVIMGPRYAYVCSPASPVLCYFSSCTVTTALVSVCSTHLSTSPQYFCNNRSCM